MVKCRIRNTKERKKISKETKFSWRDLKVMKQVEFTAHCPPEAPMESKISDTVSLLGNTWWVLVKVPPLGQFVTCNSLQQLCWQNPGAELCGRRSGAVLIDILKSLPELSHGCCWLHNLMQYSTVIPWEIVWWLGCKSCGWVRELWKKDVEKALEICFFLLPDCQGGKSKSFKQGAHLHSTADM